MDYSSGSGWICLGVGLAQWTGATRILWSTRVEEGGEARNTFSRIRRATPLKRCFKCPKCPVIDSSVLRNFYASALLNWQIDEKKSKNNLSFKSSEKHSELIATSRPSTTFNSKTGFFRHRGKSPKRIDYICIGFFCYHLGGHQSATKISRRKHLRCVKLIKLNDSIKAYHVDVRLFCQV